MSRISISVLCSSEYVTEMVGAWANSICGIDPQPFIDEEICGEVLPELTAEELETYLGIQKLGRRKLLVLRTQQFQVRKVTKSTMQQKNEKCMLTKSFFFEQINLFFCIGINSIRPDT